VTVGVETFVAICSVALFALNEIFRDVEHDDDYGARARKQPASLSGALKPRSHCRHSGCKAATRATQWGSVGTSSLVHIADTVELI